MTEFKFRFKTNAELDLAESTGYIEDYPMVRCKVTTKEGHSADFAVKTEEDFLQLKEDLRDKDHIESIEYYPSTLFFDINDYD